LLRGSTLFIVGFGFASRRGCLNPRSQRVRNSTARPRAGFKFFLGKRYCCRKQSQNLPYGPQLSDERCRDYAAGAPRQIPSSAVMTIGFGKMHPLLSNNTAAGRQESRHIELVISAICVIAFWDQTGTFTA